MLCTQKYLIISTKIEITNYCIKVIYMSTRLKTISLNLKVKIKLCEVLSLKLIMLKAGFHSCMVVVCYINSF